jgi:hypothetical protein
MTRVAGVLCPEWLAIGSVLERYVGLVYRLLSSYVGGSLSVAESLLVHCMWLRYLSLTEV